MEYDVAIIGGGPAGVTAAVYTVRYNLKTVLICPGVGGNVEKIPYIENWPGEPKAIDGAALAERFRKQIVNIGTKIMEDEVIDIKLENKLIEIKTLDGKSILAKSVILAMGRKKLKPGVLGEEEYQGKGVSYCTTCDGPLFRGKTVIVAGSGDSAIISALMLVEYAKKVYMTVKGPDFNGKPYRIEQIKSNHKIEVFYNTTIQSIFGGDFMEGVVLSNGSSIPAEGLFVEIGSVPHSELASKLGVELDKGLIIVNADMSTNIPGVYAAGDITTGSNRLTQIVTAAAEGAIAANSIFKHLK